MRRVFLFLALMVAAPAGTLFALAWASSQPTAADRAAASAVSEYLPLEKEVRVSCTSFVEGPGRATVSCRRR